MSTTVYQLFGEFSIENQCVKWGMPIQDEDEGIYVVSTSKDPYRNLGLTTFPNIDDGVMQTWINKLPDFLIDGQVVTLEKLRERLLAFWLPDESILYIGKASKRKDGTGLSTRIKEFYKTEIGEKSPHSGGQWIKVLKNLNSLYVYYGKCNNSRNIEIDMLAYFMKNVSNKSLDILYDKKLPLPFANIRFKSGIDKNTGIRNQRKK